MKHCKMKFSPLLPSTMEDLGDNLLHLQLTWTGILIHALGYSFKDFKFSLESLAIFTFIVGPATMMKLLNMDPSTVWIMLWVSSLALEMLESSSHLKGMRSEPTSLEMEVSRGKKSIQGLLFMSLPMMVVLLSLLRLVNWPTPSSKLFCLTVLTSSYSLDEVSTPMVAYQLPVEPLDIDNIFTEPTATGLKFVVSGTRNGVGYLIGLDFSKVFPRECSTR